jgi:hypothetical protein
MLVNRFNAIGSYRIAKARYIEIGQQSLSRQSR